MTDQLYNVGDRVRALRVGSKILEPAVVEERRRLRDALGPGKTGGNP